MHQEAIELIKKKLRFLKKKLDNCEEDEYTYQHLEARINNLAWSLQVLMDQQQNKR
jgi:hypothetical protein